MTPECVVESLRVMHRTVTMEHALPFLLIFLSYLSDHLVRSRWPSDHHLISRAGCLTRRIDPQQPAEVARSDHFPIKATGAGLIVLVSRVPSLARVQPDKSLLLRPACLL